jgi:hypothetical protein
MANVPETRGDPEESKKAGLGVPSIGNGIID